MQPMGHCGWFPLSRDEIRLWVQRHRDDLPRTLSDLARFPIPFRIAIVASVDPATRLQFWREHLASFVTDGSPLNPEQRALVAEAREALPTFLNEPGSPGPTLRAFEQRLR